LKKQNGKNENYVLDSSAFLALFEDEAKRRTRLMNRLAITRVESSQELGLIAGRLKATHKISFADTWIAATAIFYDAILVHKDPEFEQVEDKLKFLNLPYKR